MPIYNGNKIENLTPIEAYKRGYLLPHEYEANVKWVDADFANRRISTTVYINGVYVGVATKNMKLFEIILKFNL